MRELIQKIEKSYVGEECIQVMFAYNEAMCILKHDEENKNIVFYHNYKPQHEYEYVNLYISDDRKEQFPYSNIPIHKEKRGKIIKKEVTLVNQLLDYDTIYEIIRDNVPPLYCKVLKDKTSAIIIQGLELSQTFDMDISELRHAAIPSLKPDIKNKYNPGISKEEIETQKRLVKSLENKK